MEILLLLAGGILVYAIFKQASTMKKADNVIETKQEYSENMEGYNKHILNQYSEWKDEINSQDIIENHIHEKPYVTAHGLYGIPEKQLKTNPVSALVPVNTIKNLNL